MLRSMSGQTHRVYTGVAIHRYNATQSATELLASGVDTTEVTFRQLSDAVIWDYIETGEPMDKAGAYGAQGYAAPFIERFVGDFYNVVGLPLCLLGQLLESAGFNWWHHRTAMPPITG